METGLTAPLPGHTGLERNENSPPASGWAPEEANPCLCGRISPEVSSICPKAQCCRGASCLPAEPHTPAQGHSPLRKVKPPDAISPTSPLPLALGENWLGPCMATSSSAVCVAEVGALISFRLPSLKTSFPWCFINNTYILEGRNVAKENVSLGTSRKLRRKVF